MTMNEARSALIVPADKANNNCVQDAQARLRSALDLAGNFHSGDEPAPAYVVEMVRCLTNWLAQL